MKDREAASRRKRLTEYWIQERVAIPRASKRSWERHLDKERVLAQRTCLVTGWATLTDAIELILIDEDSLAVTFLEHAELYIETAIERDDVGPYGEGGDLTRASRLQNLLIARWLRAGVLDLAEFRRSCAIEAVPFQRLFALDDWEKTGYGPSEWMLHLIIAEDPEQAVTVFGKYLRGAAQRRHRATLGAPDEVLFEVAKHLTMPDDSDQRRRAEERLDAFYARITDWEEKRTLREVLLNEKLLYAYVRGKHFKGVTDPIRLIKMMKFSE